MSGGMRVRHLERDPVARAVCRMFSDFPISEP